MPELIRNIQDKILSDREIWSAGKGNDVSIALEKDKCTFHVTNSHGSDITTLIASNLSALNIKYNLYQAIDCWMLEVSQTEKEHVLKLIDSEW